MEEKESPVKSSPEKKIVGHIRIQDSIMRYVGYVEAVINEILGRLKRPVDTIYKVAVERMDEGDYADAASRLKLVVKMRPEFAEAWYNLGHCLMLADDRVAAASALRRAVGLAPQHEEARFLLTTVDPQAVPVDKQPKYIPLPIVTSYFDGMAMDYDDVQLDLAGYNGHEEIHSSVTKYLNPDYKRFHIVDLGCGTGLVGMLFRDVAGKIEGVDISRLLLEQAQVRRDSKERRIYDATHLIDLRRFLLDQPPKSIDIVLAANVFPYVGGLTPVFDGVGHALKPGGIFAFSVEPLRGDDFALLPGEGRFGHSEQYITELAKRAGLDVLEMRPIPLYAKTEGMQYVLRKPVPAAPDAS